MPKSLRSLDDHVQDTLDARRRTQSGRFQPAAPGTERVADVIASSCAAVAGAFAGLGFRWSKSGLHFSRKVGPFTHIVSFQADSANSSGAHVGVALHARTKSAELARWREANGVTTGDYVWGTQIGYLSQAHEYLKWQLVDPARRQEEIDSMVKTIHELAMPAFDVCCTKETLSARLLERREMTWIPDWAVDIALWVGNKAAAEALVLKKLESPPGMAAQFIEYYRIEVSAPSLSRPDDRNHCLAWVARRHGLQVPGVV
ncbi:hypothetical protein ACEN8I_19275 [Polaromonas sp. CT11-55]|uniref:hypothetical protein n=1 Tax=Polaromonas sp. CT11-55 TaxID=3243045 RepID=UPI0039A6B1F1